MSCLKDWSKSGIGLEAEVMVYRTVLSTLLEHVNRSYWRSEVYHKTKKGHEDYIRAMKDWRRRKKAEANLARGLP